MLNAECLLVAHHPIHAHGVPLLVAVDVFIERLLESVRSGVHRPHQMRQQAVVYLAG